MQYNNFTSIPYTQDTLKKRKRVINYAGVKVAIKPVHTINQILLSPKKVAQFIKYLVLTAILFTLTD